MAKTQSPEMQKHATHCAVLLLFLTGWFATAATGACVLHAPSYSVSDGDSDIEKVSAPAGGASDISDRCCVLRGKTYHQPTLAPGPAIAEPKPGTPPVLNTVQRTDFSSVVLSVSSDTDTPFPRRPLYLIYSRLLISSFFSS